MTTDDARAIELSLLRTCPVGCIYCPQDVLRRASRERGMTTALLDEKDLSIILGHAAAGSANGVAVSFAGFTEPFKHPRAIDLIELCEHSSSVTDIGIYTTGEE